ncbi:hypothetical protein DM860_005253 [Cuscuta australis]|uniref:Reverse transcriptase zinc-binding domain-containing protein n=1 Tax=Cuscuta australis TaxID=267555 RepID=A0A328DYZ2_9ASTE|nr:hypothetical protein DM860_005253 [Cuscuta australis]
MEVLERFNKCTRLQINKEKSSIVFGGCKEDLEKEIISITPMNKGKLPFIYLGCPISSSRLSIQDCDKLVEKICAKITTWSSKHLTYAGRVRLINTVLMGIITFWARIFLIPSKVMKTIQAICRNFLWNSKAKYSKVPLMSWEETCLPKRCGGLGLRNMVLWNKASIMKLNWDIHNRKDILWVQWIHTRYIKNENYWEYTPRPNCCNSWTQMMEVRNLFASMPKGERYTTQQGYEWLLGEHPKPTWTDWVWNRVTLPKCQFIMWLIMRGRIQTKVRLARVMEVDTTCFFCQNGEEDISHLLCRCELAKEVLGHIAEWMQTKLEGEDIVEMAKGITKNTPRKKRKEVLAGWATTCYYIWRARNWKRHDKEIQVEEIVGTIKYHCSVCFSSFKGG